MKHTTRRRFLALAPLTGAAMLTACSPAPAPAPAVAPAPAPAAPAAPSAISPAPVSTPAPSAPAPASASPAAAPATGGPLVDEKDPQAIALLYVSDAAKFDKSKSPAYVAGSQCSNCALYQGAASSAAGGCPLFPGKQVLAGARCSAWAKKA